MSAVRFAGRRWGWSEVYLGSDNYLGTTAYLGSGDNTPPVPLGDETLIEWLDLTLHGREGRFTIQRLEGWEDLPDARGDWVQRPNQHGAFDTPVFAQERHVMTNGLCASMAERDALLLELQRSMVFTDQARELRIWRAGRQLSVAARLVRFKATSEVWGAGAFPWAAEWVAADPYRYGPLRQAYTTLPEQVGGLEFDLFTDGTATTGVLEFGEQGSTGRVVLSNEGTADAWPVFEVRGPAPAGFTVQHVATGRRIVSTTVIPAGSSLVVNTANGMAALDGADRSGQLLVREWQPVAPGGDGSFAFFAPVEGPAALVASIRSTYW